MRDFGTIKLHEKGKIVEAPIDSCSVIDPMGRVFHYRGGIYRAISKGGDEIVREFLNQKNLDQIFDKGLIRTELTDIKAEGYGVVVKHHNVEFKSLPYEWSGNMIQDICRMIMQLGAELYIRGYSFKDGHQFNSFFDYYKPIWIDFGSILPIKNIPNSRRLEPLDFPWEFSGTFIHQSYIFLEKSGAINISKEDMFAIREKYISDPIEFFCAMDDYFSNIEFKYGATEWTGYGNSHVADTNPKVIHTKKFLQDIGESTLIDIGASKGRFSELGVELGYDVVAFDLDASSIAKLYSKTKKSKNNILSLVVDLTKMTPQIEGHLPFTERVRCDVSMFLAVIHHLSLKRKVPFETIAQNLSDLTGKYSIVEFIPKGDRHVGGWGDQAWYSMDNFIKVMDRHFHFLEVINITPEPRKLLFFRKKYWWTG